MPESIAIFYGHVASNVGDIAINRGEIEMLAAAYPAARIHVVLLNAKKSVYLETSEASFGPHDVVLHHVASSNARASQLASDPSGWLAECGVADADMIVLAAGEHLFSYADNSNDHNLFWRTLPAFAAWQTGKPCLMMPSTFGPFETADSSTLMRQLVRATTRVAARDARSREVLAGLMPDGAADLLLDPAFFLPAPPAPQRPAGPRNIGLVMRSERWGIRLADADRKAFKQDDEAFFQEDRGARFSLDYARRVLSQSDCTLTMFVQTFADKELAQAVDQGLNPALRQRLRIVEVATIEAYLEALSAVDCVVASRFHALIMGMVCGRPGLGIYFDVHGHKIPGLMDLVGRPADCINLSQTAMDEAVETAFARTVAEPLDDEGLATRLGNLRERTRSWLAEPLEPVAAMDTLPDEVKFTLLKLAAGVNLGHSRALEKKLATAQNERKVQSARRRQLEARISDTTLIEAKMRDLSSELSAARSEQSRLQARIDKTELALRSANSLSYALQQDLKKAEGEIGEQTALAKKFSSMAYRAQKELDNERSRSDALVRRLRAELAQLSDDLTAERVRNTEISNDLAAARRAAVDLEQKNRQATANHSRLEARISSLQTSTSFALGNAIVKSIKSPRSSLTAYRQFRATLSRRKAQDGVLQGQDAKPMASSDRHLILGLLRDGGVDAVVAALASRGGDAATQAKTLVSAARVAKEARRADDELELLRRAARKNPSSSTLRSLFWTAQRTGDLQTAWQTLRQLKSLTKRSTSDLEKAFFDKIEQSPVAALYLLDQIEKAPSQYEFPSNPDRVCYVLHNSLPYSSGGYATRGHGLAGGLVACAMEPIVVTRPGYPLDIRSELNPSDIDERDVIDGIAYLRDVTWKRSGVSAKEYMTIAADILSQKIEAIAPSCVVAASNHVTALPALIAARRLGLPFIYEVRGFWEVTRLSREPEFGNSTAYRVQKMLEAETAKRADHVFTLTGPMKEELIRRGVPAERITLIPNSCEPERFAPRDRDRDLSARLGIPLDVPVIGYVGTFVQYEGLELLAEAAAILRERGHDFRLLLVGNENASGTEVGPITAQIQRICAERGLADRVIMPGRVPHEEVEAYYSLIDIAPFPRKSQPVTEMVSPMKPLEAFAMEKAVVASSVAALAEMVEHERTGLIFEKDNVENLADTLARLIGDPQLRRRLGSEARRWVEANRTWTATARIAADKIREIAGSGNASPAAPTETAAAPTPQIAVQIATPSPQPDAAALLAERTVLLFASAAEIASEIAANESDARRQSEILVLAARSAAQAERHDISRELLRYAVERFKSGAVLRSVFWAAQKAGDLLTAYEAVRELRSLPEHSLNAADLTFMEKTKRSPSLQLELLDLVPEKPQQSLTPVGGRLGYILHNSLPYASGGYATRAQGLALGLQAQSLHVHVVTRPGFPLDNNDELTDVPVEESIEGVAYHRILKPSRSGSSAVGYVTSAADALTEAFKEIRPRIVVAASNYQTALPALIAARRLGLPFVYEVRGFWEVTRVSREPEFAVTPAYKIQELMETETAKRADHVFTLTGPMKEELIRRGVPAERITLLPNSCEPERFTPRDRDRALSARLGIPLDVPVIGYVGTFVQYEGLELLAEAAAILRERGHDFRLLLVGNENVSGSEVGPITAQIQRICAERGLTDRVIMPGRVPHEEVEAYYSLIDIAPFPRKSQPVTEMVSPMKPLEAFAMEKAVVASSVAALAEMVEHERTGLIFEKDNVENLADTLARLIGDPQLRRRLGSEARRWVETNRTWTATARTAADKIREIVAGAR
jgi:glycosyltransferase involved in cell wall biosynthesis/polysaccharide pyruvyl transferase WcaK-like protein